MTEQDEQQTERQPTECLECETELSGDDPTYRVLYGTFDEVAAGEVSEKLVAGPNETLDPGAREEYYCRNCYNEQFRREHGAHYQYETVDELWDILEAADGRLVADTYTMTVGGRGWFRVVDGEVEARHAVRIVGDEDDDFDLRFGTEPTPDVDEQRFQDIFDVAEDLRNAILKHVSETPFVAGMNRTLGVDYDD